MANVILPIVIFELFYLGSLVNLRNYHMGMTNKRIFDDNTTVVERTLNEFNSTYYVLPDERVPSFGLPADYQLRTSYTSDYNRGLFGLDTSGTSNYVSAQVMIVTEYKTLERSLKEGEAPIPEWQNYIKDIPRIPQNPTHYIDKMGYGGRCIAYLTVFSRVRGDLQVSRRILREVMGTSGQVGEDTIDLWNKAVKAIRESKDIRGRDDLDFYHFIHTRGVDLPRSASTSVEVLLDSLRKFSKFVKSYPDNKFTPLYLSLKPLHDLDEQYPLLVKNYETERYMIRLNEMVTDLGRTINDVKSVYQLVSDEDYAKYSHFIKNSSSIKRKLLSVVFDNLSMYEAINVTAAKEAFKLYQQGLDNSTETYLAAFERLSEEIIDRCQNSFLTPTRGLLKVEANEVFGKGKMESVEDCQDVCLEDKRCRAVGYSEADQECLIYYRSTRSAKIAFSEDGSKIYDRNCS